MKKKIRLLMDCDGVLADFVGGTAKLYNRITGRKLDPASIKVWDFTGSLEFETPEQREYFEHLLRSPGFAMHLEPLSGSREAVAILKNLVDLHIVTSPLSDSTTWVHERVEWLKLHYGIDKKHIHHSDTKFVYSGDLFVDDKPEHVRAWDEENPNGMALLWSTPGNQGEKDVTYIGSWEGLIDLIKSRRKS